MAAPRKSQDQSDAAAIGVCGESPSGRMNVNGDEGESTDRYQVKPFFGPGAYIQY